MKASAIVTGGSGGQGVAVADELLSAGWRVVSGAHIPVYGSA